MLLLFVVLVVARVHHHRHHRLQTIEDNSGQKYRVKILSNVWNEYKTRKSTARNKIKHNRFGKPVYFHDIYQQYAPNYPNYAAPSSDGGSQADINRLLEIHKRTRGRSIQWNSKIARLAQMHANNCPTGHANLPRGASGQNMAWTSTYEDSANMWASEGTMFSYRFIRGTL
eukprot:NODE_125_length_18781_cov_0.243015.p8 type:complete len:171 gc:universal NODE_125_length_18781_cov_0.243015:9124-8612(-)